MSSPSDPLAPALQPKPAVAAPAAKVSSASPSSITRQQPASTPPTEKPAVPKKTKAGLIVVLAAVFLLLAGGGSVAALFLLPQGDEGQVAESQPQVPDPGSPPAIPAFTLATSTASYNNLTDQRLKPDDLQAAANTLAPKLMVGAGETSAPRDMIVRGGTGGDAVMVVPHHERWELSFPVGTTIETYSRQLDHFKIELGVIGGAANVSYLSNLVSPKPRVQTAKAGTDARIYLTWNRGPLREVDDILVTRAGLDPSGKVIAHFIPQETEAEMLRVEAAAAQASKLSRVRKTVFTIQTVAADQYRLTVSEQKGE